MTKPDTSEQDFHADTVEQHSQHIDAMNEQIDRDYDAMHERAGEAERIRREPQCDKAT